MNDLYLAHHGIKGQKWGVRRFQNADGSYTNAGKKRYGGNDSENKKSFPTKKVVAGALVGVGLATAAALYAKNPQAVKSALSKVKDVSVNAMNSVGDNFSSRRTYKRMLRGDRTGPLTKLEKEAIRGMRRHDIVAAPKIAFIRGSEPIRQFGNGVREGFENGVRNFPKNTGKMLGEGALALAGMTIVNKLLSEDNVNKMISAYNNGKSKDKRYKNVKLDSNSFKKQAAKDFSAKRTDAKDDE